MRSRLLARVVLLGLALAGVGCAAGTAIPTGDGGTRDAQADAVPPLDGATDGFAVDTSLPGDAAGDAVVQSDGPGAADALPQQDGGLCAVQNTGDCDPVCQNCGGGNRCVISSANHQLATCIANGTVPGGGACTGTATEDNCVAGFICLSGGTCTRFCRTEADCAADNGACIIGINWDGTTPFRACKSPDACQPVANTGCPTGSGCFLWNSDSQTFCLTAGSGTQGALCPNGNECAGGYLCVGNPPTDPYACRRVCQLTSPTCPTSTTCQTLTGFTTYGFCG